MKTLLFTCSILFFSEAFAIDYAPFPYILTTEDYFEPTTKPTRRVINRQTTRPAPIQLGYWSPLHEAAYRGDLAEVRRLVRNGADMWLRADKKEWGECAIDAAGYAGHVEVVKYMLEKMPDLAGCQDYYGNFPIHKAAMAGNLNVVKIYVSRNLGSIDQEDVYGRTALHKASKSGQLSVVRWLVNEGAAVRKRSNTQGYGMTPIHMAARFGQLGVVRYFINEVDNSLTLVTDDNGDTPLHLAVKSGNLPIVRFLATSNPETVFARNNRGQGAIEVAQSGPNADINNELIQFLRSEVL